MEIGASGLGFNFRAELPDRETILEALHRPNSRRIFALRQALAAGISEEEIFAVSAIDPWFIRQVRDIVDMKGRNLVPFVAASEPYAWFDNQPQKVALAADGAYAWRGTGLPLLVYDFGIKWNILRRLCEAGFEPLAVPPNFSAQQAKASGANGVFLSNGPGDPATLTGEIALVRELIGRFPVTGICLGHQLIGHALGGCTDKLKFGHHGCNHPVKDLTTGRIEISSQNHGFHG